MAVSEVPLLRCSSTYASRLITASKKFSESRYQFYRRVNWSYRYSKLFHENETACFIENPQKYIDKKIDWNVELEDVFKIRLPIKQVGIVTVKVFAHWLFYICGQLFDPLKKNLDIYRKAYVDDIELVFDSDQAGVLRAVFPFPLNVGRQLRYLRFLRKKGYEFKLSGNPYSALDFFIFLLRRDVRSLQRMESRAQMRHAYEVAAEGFKLIQISDEFDVGSLDFCRAIRRFPIRIINSAHGVGTYLPIHAYHEFHVLTRRQGLYYLPIYGCEYKVRSLNVRTNNLGIPTSVSETSNVTLVFLSQISFSVSQIVTENEKKVVGTLAAEFSSVPGIDLIYKSHPNNHSTVIPLGFKPLQTLDAVNGQAGVIFVSLFSTCYLDPNFVGRKVLIRSGLIYPELVFDNMDDIYCLEDFTQHLRSLLSERMDANSISSG